MVTTCNNLPFTVEIAHHPNHDPFEGNGSVQHKPDWYSQPT